MDDGYDANPIRIPGQADTTRPTFKTDMGRVVLGGGGITPDVIAGDSITPFAVQALARAMGKDLGAYRDALAKLSLSLKRAGVVKSRDEPVTRDMLDALYRDLESRKVAPDRRIFDSASPLDCESSWLRDDACRFWPRRGVRQKSAGRRGASASVYPATACQDAPRGLCGA